jgi:hypothetical protein
MKWIFVIEISINPTTLHHSFSLLKKKDLLAEILFNLQALFQYSKNNVPFSAIMFTSQRKLTEKKVKEKPDELI